MLQLRVLINTLGFFPQRAKSVGIFKGKLKLKEVKDLSRSHSFMSDKVGTQM